MQERFVAVVTACKRYFTTLFTRVFKLIAVNMLFFLVTLPVYLFLMTELNRLAAMRGLGIVGVLAALLSYAADGLPNAVKIVLLVLSALLYGPACAGLCRVTDRYVQQEHASPASDFFLGAKENAKQAVVTGAIDLLALYASFQYLFSPELLSGMNTLPLRIAWGILSGIYFCYRCFLYPIMVNVELSFGALLKDALLLGILSLPRVLVIVLLVGLLAVGSLYADIVLLPLFGYALLGFTASSLTYPVLRRHLYDGATMAQSRKK